MSTLIALHNRALNTASLALENWFVPTLARFALASTLLFFFWNSALTKLGDGLFGIFSPSVGAYAQIFPKQMEAAGYDPSQLSFFHTLIVLAGTYAEFLLPALVALGLLTRLSALAMIGFVFVMSFVDITGHGLDTKSIGAIFDRDPYGLIADQRLLWVTLLLVLVAQGGGPFSLDRLLRLR